MKLAGPLLWVLAGALLLYVVRPRDRGLEALEARADSLRVAAVRAETELRSVLEREAVRVGQHQAERDSALARADRAERRRPAVIERVVERAGPDSAVVRAAVREVVDSIEVYELSPLRAALAAADSVAASAFRQRDAALAANAALRVALEASRAEADAWEDLAGGTVFGIRVEPELAYLAGLGTAGALIAWVVR